MLLVLQSRKGHFSEKRKKSMIHSPKCVHLNYLFTNKHHVIFLLYYITRYISYCEQFIRAYVSFLKMFQPHNVQSKCHKWSFQKTSTPKSTPNRQPNQPTFSLFLIIFYTRAQYGKKKDLSLLKN